MVDDSKQMLSHAMRSIMLVQPEAQISSECNFFPFLFVSTNVLEKNWHLMPRLKCIPCPFFCFIKVKEPLFLPMSPCVRYYSLSCSVICSQFTWMKVRFIVLVLAVLNPEMVKRKDGEYPKKISFYQTM